MLQIRPPRRNRRPVSERSQGMQKGRGSLRGPSVSVSGAVPQLMSSGRQMPSGLEMFPMLSVHVLAVPSVPSPSVAS
jgi:hypothetical protein